MTPDASFCSGEATAAEPARMMATKDIGALPVCGGDGRLSVVVTDRDLALPIVAEGRDPNATRLSSARRLPVGDGTTLVGIFSQADIARSMPDAMIGNLVGFAQGPRGMYGYALPEQRPFGRLASQ